MEKEKRHEDEKNVEGNVDVQGKRNKYIFLKIKYIFLFGMFGERKMLKK